MVEPEFIVKLTNGIIGWRSDSSCDECGRGRGEEIMPCFFYFNNPHSWQRGAKLNFTSKEISESIYEEVTRELHFRD